MKLNEAGRLNAAESASATSRSCRTKRLVGEALCRSMITPTGKAVEQHYGFGLVHETLRGEQMLQHGGSIPCFNSYLLYLPRSRAT